jgi:zinc D-Ala-D-Ala carboxypeptidase
MFITKNFNPTTDPKLRCTCGHEKCDQRGVKFGVLQRVQQVREWADRSLIVTSGGRCEHHPNEAHRTTPADHQKCMALDISVRGGTERGELVKLGLDAGFNAIGIAKTFVHLGYRPELGEEVVMWVY